MGYEVSASYAKHFIKEFSADFEKHFNFDSTHVVEQGLVEWEENIYYGVVIKASNGDESGFIMPECIFNYEDTLDHQLNGLCDFLLEDGDADYAAKQANLAKRLAKVQAAYEEDDGEDE